MVAGRKLTGGASDVNQFGALFLKGRGRGRIRWGKGLEVVGLFAETDKFYGQVEFVLDGNDHAAFRGAIQFRDNKAGQRYGFVELPCLAQCIGTD